MSTIRPLTSTAARYGRAANEISAKIGQHRAIERMLRPLRAECYAFYGTTLKTGFYGSKSHDIGQTRPITSKMLNYWRTKTQMPVPFITFPLSADIPANKRRRKAQNCCVSDLRGNARLHYWNNIYILSIKYYTNIECKKVWRAMGRS